MISDEATLEAKFKAITWRQVREFLNKFGE
jgi:hypothetical protein